MRCSFSYMQQGTNKELTSTDLIIDDILEYWFAAPAANAEQMQQKITRWYMGGEPMDLEIRERFGRLVEAALSDELTSFHGSSRGRLALILLLDQFTRNIFRNTPRAYAGDAKALALALAELERGTHRLCSAEGALFLIMPLVHAEELTLQTRAAGLAHDIAKQAPACLRSVFMQGAERAEHYRSIIERFGRFPHRNVILGRPSSQTELAFLATQPA